MEVPLDLILEIVVVVLSYLVVKYNVAYKKFKKLIEDIYLALQDDKITKEEIKKIIDDFLGKENNGEQK